MTVTQKPSAPTPPAANPNAMAPSGGSYTRQPDGTLLPTQATPAAEPTSE